MTNKAFVLDFEPSRTTILTQNFYNFSFFFFLFKYNALQCLQRKILLAVFNNNEKMFFGESSVVKYQLCKSAQAERFTESTLEK